MKSVKEIFRSWAVLNADGVHVNGTDKESNHHYGDAYEKLFALPFNPMFSRATTRLVMEIGVADGSSLRAWAEVFPNARIVGLDIHHADKAAGHERIEFHRGDATVLEDCRRAAGSGRQFDLIVEDATHVLGDTLTTLLYLWPHVKVGGLYVIEEFANIGVLWSHVQNLFDAQIVKTFGPSGGCEPLVVLYKNDPSTICNPVSAE